MKKNTKRLQVKEIGRLLVTNSKRKQNTVRQRRYYTPQPGINFTLKRKMIQM